MLGLAFRLPGDSPSGVDIAVNASGRGAGLQAAIDAAGREAVVVEGAAQAQDGQPLTLRRHAGYDHGYYFIQSFVADHLEHHHHELTT